MDDDFARFLEEVEAGCETSRVEFHGLLDVSNHMSNEKNPQPLVGFYGGWVNTTQLYGDYSPENEWLEPQNGGLEDDFPFQTGDFQVPC